MGKLTIKLKETPSNPEFKKYSVYTSNSSGSYDGSGLVLETNGKDVSWLEFNCKGEGYHFHVQKGTKKEFLKYFPNFVTDEVEIVCK